MAKLPEREPVFCGGIDWNRGFDPWLCGGVMHEFEDGEETIHLCAASYDHGDEHVCAFGHRWEVSKPRRRLRDRLLHRAKEGDGWS